MKHRLIAVILLLFGTASTYIVQPGDTLTAIAQRHNTTVRALVEANNIQNPDLIWIGQRLEVPDGETPPAPTTGPRKGLAMAMPQYQGDLAALGIEWWYVWGWCEGSCTPMVRSMQLPPSCPATLIVGNEPNAREPYGASIPPGEAVDRVLAIKSRCPDTRLVVGNVSADDWSKAGGYGSGYTWLAEFLWRYRHTTGQTFSDTLGVHCYTTYSASYCIRQLRAMRRLYAGPMWVTEFGVLSGSPYQFRKLAGYIMTGFERMAAYTNRQPGTGQGWELGPGVELIAADGSLTPAGEVYASLRP